MRFVIFQSLIYFSIIRHVQEFHLNSPKKRLSADTINFTASSSSVTKGETLLDTVNNILSMKVDMIVMRHSATGAPHFLAKQFKEKNITVAIVNAGDGINEHPTQGLLDAFSINEKLGVFEGKKIAIIGDVMHSRVADEQYLFIEKMGAEVTVAGSATLIPKYMKEAFRCKSGI